RLITTSALAMVSSSTSPVSGFHWTWSPEFGADLTSWVTCQPFSRNTGMSADPTNPLAPAITTRLLTFSAKVLPLAIAKYPEEMRLHVLCQDRQESLTTRAIKD